jgi:hypothetical protein
MTAITITLPYNRHEDSISPWDWAKDNCPSYITNDVEALYEYGDYIVSRFVVKYHFYDEADAVMFALRWS